ncbi:MAG: hypothetical protein ABJA50_03210 [Chloroflexota bacterium]
MVQRSYLLFGVLASLCAIALAGCGSATTPLPSPTGTGGTSVELIQVPETGAYRDAIAKDLGDITWTAITVTTGITQETAARGAVLEAIKAHGGELAAVDYSALSLDAFKDVTRQVHLTADSFAGGDARLEYTGEQDGQLAWLLYDYRGQMIPQLPGRPQVFRWVQVYALYDVRNARLIRLVATVRGEVQE